MRKVLIGGAFALAASGLAGCDPYAQGPYAPGPQPGPGGGWGHTPRPGEVVEVVGCPRAGVETRCLVLQGADGRAWNITGVQPTPFGEWAVRATGRTAVSGMSYCQEGMLLTDVRWEYTNMRCVGGAVQGYPGGYPPPSPRW